MSLFVSVVYCNFVFLACIYMHMNVHRINKKETNFHLKVAEHLTSNDQEVLVSPRFQKVIKSCAIFQKFKEKNSSLTF